MKKKKTNLNDSAKYYNKMFELMTFDLRFSSCMIIALVILFCMFIISQLFLFLRH
ncbi:hypothetical protein GvMRE_IIg400 [endosymbiont GvMRE of Glomus versiforme]|nr:hypothetical protein GvMRE_IIg400 [endosymbiont GvMRE of Glomus versiforme]